MITLCGLTKRYRDVIAVDDLSLNVHAGAVTGFLGPNGAGKTSTIKMLLGLCEPTSGSALINGRRYRDLRWPLREVGAALDVTSTHPRRSARKHLLALAASIGAGPKDVEKTLDRVGLSEAARRPVGTFSLGMVQRLSLAAALLGDPATFILDEPLSGLDPEGVRWLRDLLRELADNGRTVLISSHLLSEMSLTADRVAVIGHGRLLADTSLDDFIEHHSAPGARIRTADQVAMSAALDKGGARASLQPDGALHVTAMTATRIGDIALSCGIAISELTPLRTDLEHAFFAATRHAVDYADQSTPAPAPAPAFQHHDPSTP